MLPFPFQFGFPFISFCFLIAVAKSSKLCCIKVARVAILVLFLILEEILSPFHCWVWYQLYVCHIWPLLCWDMFPLHRLLESFIINGYWVLSEASCASLLRWSYDFYSLQTLFTRKFLCKFLWEWLSLCHVCLCDPMDCSPPGSSVHGIL